MSGTDLRARARAVLAANDLGGYTRPAPWLYPFQWNWDSAIVALGLSAQDPKRAGREILTLLSGQWRNGMLPHILFHTVSPDYFPGPETWHSSVSPQAPLGLPTSGITQPPLLATVVRRMHARAPDQHVAREFLRQVFPGLRAYHAWLHRERDPEGSGLVALIHPWESGTDDSPRWDEPLRGIDVPSHSPTFQRRDVIHVARDQRPTDEDYRRYIYLLDLFRGLRYEQPAILDASPFLVYDVLFNAILYQSDQDLLALAVELGEPTQEMEAWVARMRTVFQARLWDAESGLYRDFDLRSQRLIQANTAATFGPLYAGLADASTARRLVEEHLLNPDEYAPDARTRYWVPTSSKAGSGWDPRRYWRGPVWILTNWLIAEGLRRYGWDDLAKTIDQHSLELVSREGFYEYYDPRHGQGCGTSQFSWTAALILEQLTSQEGSSTP